MPHEKIYQNTKDPSTETYVMVNWQKGSFAQIGVSRKEDETASVVWTENLTREQINELIRSLRRARNLAFGRDE